MAPTPGWQKNTDGTCNRLWGINRRYLHQVDNKTIWHSYQVGRKIQIALATGWWEQTEGTCTGLTEKKDKTCIRLTLIKKTGGTHIIQTENAVHLQQVDGNKQEVLTPGWWGKESCFETPLKSFRMFFLFRQKSFRMCFRKFRDKLELFRYNFRKKFESFLV